MVVVAVAVVVVVAVGVAVGVAVAVGVGVVVGVVVGVAVGVAVVVGVVVGVIVSDRKEYQREYQRQRRAAVRAQKAENKPFYSTIEEMAADGACPQCERLREMLAAEHRVVRVLEQKIAILSGASSSDSKSPLSAGPGLLSQSSVAADLLTPKQAAELRLASLIKAVK